MTESEAAPTAPGATHGSARRLAAAAIVALLAAWLSACATYQAPGTPPRPQPLVQGLSVVETPAAATGGDTFVVLYSGDGGWAKVDDGVARALADLGLPTAGVDSLRYFWKRHTPAQAGADLARIVSEYSRAWGRPKVILAGYSFGASALPLVAADLPADVRAKVSAFVLIAPRKYIELLLRPNSWVDIPGPHTQPLNPAIAALKSDRVLCLYGVKDHIADCPHMPPGLVQSHPFPGGHRFNGDFAAVAKAVAEAAK